jgi:hypothetical protein
MVRRLLGLLALGVAVPDKSEGPTLRYPTSPIAERPLAAPRVLSTATLAVPRGRASTVRGISGN